MRPFDLFRRLRRIPAVLLIAVPMLGGWVYADSTASSNDSSAVIAGNTVNAVNAASNSAAHSASSALSEVPPPPDDFMPAYGIEREYASGTSLRRKGKLPEEYTNLLEPVQQTLGQGSNNQIQTENWQKKPELGLTQATYVDPQGRRWEATPEAVNTGANDGYELVSPVLSTPKDDQDLEHILTTVESGGAYERGIRSSMHVTMGVERLLLNAVIQNLKTTNPERYAAVMDALKNPNPSSVEYQRIVAPLMTPEALKNVNINSLVDTILSIESHWKEIYSAVSPMRYGTVINRFSVPLVIDHPQLLQELQALPPEQRTWGNVRDIFMKYDDAEVNGAMSSDPVKRQYFAWKNRAANYKGLFALDGSNSVRPVIEFRIPDLVAPPQIVKITQFLRRVVGRSASLRQPSDPFVNPFQGITNRDAQNRAIYDSDRSAYRAYVSSLGLNPRDYPKLGALEGPPIVGISGERLQQAVQAANLSDAPAQDIRVAGFTIHVERASGQGGSVLRMTIPKGSVDANAQLNIDAWLGRVARSVDATGFVNGDTSLHMIYRSGEKQFNGDTVIEFRGKPGDAAAIDQVASKVIAGFQNPNLIRGFPELGAAFNGPRETLSEFYNRYFMKYSNHRLTPEKKLLLENLDAATSRYAYPLYGFEDAPFLSKADRVQIENKNLEFYKAVMKLINSDQVKPYLYRIQSVSPQIPQVAPPPQEILDQYTQLLKNWANDVNIDGRLNRALLSDLPGGRAPQTAAERFAMEGSGLPTNFGRNLGRKSYVKVVLTKLNPKYAKVAFINKQYFIDRGLPVPTPEEALAQWGWKVRMPGDDPRIFLDETKIEYATRYGGGGMKKNFGDARRSNGGMYSTKGVGTTPLLRANPQGDHSDGAAGLEEGEYEAIYGEEAQRVLPSGSDRVTAVIAVEKPGSQAEPSGLIVSEETTRGAYYMPLSAGQGRSLRESDPLRSRETEQYVTDALPLSHDIQVTADLGATNAGLTEFEHRVADYYATTIANRDLHGAPSASNIQIDGRANDFGTFTVQERWGSVQAINAVSPFGDLGGPAEYQVRQFLLAAVKGQNHNLTPEQADAAVAPFMTDFHARFQWKLRQEMNKLTGVPGGIAEHLAGSQASDELGDTLYQIAREGGQFVQYHQLPWPPNRDEVVQRLGKYDLKDILLAMVRTKSSDPTVLNASIERLLPDENLRNTLVTRYAAYMNAVVPEAAKEGISEQALRTYQANNAEMLLKSVPGLDRPWMSMNGFQAKNRYVAGDENALSNFIEQTTASTTRRYGSTTDTVLTLNQSIDSKSDTLTRYTYDAVHDRYGVSVTRLNSTDPSPIRIHLEDGQILQADPVKSLTGMESAFTLPKPSDRIASIQFRDTQSGRLASYSEDEGDVMKCLRQAF